MHRRLISMVLATALMVPTAVMLTAVAASAATFSNPASITLNNPVSGTTGCTNPSVDCNAPASPYPSNISVSGLSGTIGSVSATLSATTYAFSQDIGALLVGPNGNSLILVAGLGPSGGGSAGASNSTITFSDSGVLPASFNTPWGSGNTFKPTNYGSYGLGMDANEFNEFYDPPAPGAPWGDPGQHGTNATFQSQFGGAAPNGTWSLYVITMGPGDGTGAIAGGWSLNITTAAAPATTTTLSSVPNPSFTSGASSSVTLTATVSSTSTVNEGTVDFTDGGSTVAGCGAKAVSAGQATCTATFATEGNHPLSAQYSGTANFGPSDGTLTQQANDHTTVTGSSFCNTGAIGLNNPPSTVADASPYPSRVFVSGLAGALSHVTVALIGVTYPESQDIDALLVGPAGQSFIVVSDAGPNSAGALSNVSLTLDDNAASTISSGSPWGAPNSSVTSKPVNYGGVNETFDPPAPAGPYGNPGPNGGGTATLGTVFDGTNPNGTWSLYVITTAAGDGTGSIGGGWCANVTTASVAATNTAVSSNNNPSFTAAPGNSVAFTATVTKASDSSNLSEGTVDFTDGGVTISGCGAQPVSAGQATCTTAFSSEGSHTIEALYSGDANFGASDATLTQAVNDHTTITGNSFCNTGSIALNNPTISAPAADATPFPSDVFVTGQPGSLQHLAVTLNGTTYSHSQDIDALLVGPTGQTVILVAAAGPNSGGALSNVTLTVDDNAASTLSSSLAWGGANSSVSSKPVNYGGANENFGPPAPAGPYGNPGPFGGGSATLGGTFDGASPNGTWSLYVITTAGGDGTGAVAGGWCLNVTTPAPPVISEAFGAANIALNGTTSLSFTMGNPAANTVPLTGVGFTDTLPAGLVVATPNGVTPTTGCGAGTVTATAASSAVTLAGATVAVGGSCTFSVNVSGTTAGTKNNSVTVTSTNGATGNTATASVGVAVTATPTATSLAVTTTLGVGANPYGVAVDPTNHDVYVTSNGANTVSVINGGAVTATIGVGTSPEGVAVDQLSHTVYVANNGANTVSVINGGAVTATIGVGISPEGVAVDPNNHNVYVANNGSNTVSVINGGAVTATVGVGASPEGVAVDPFSHTVYVTNNGANTVSVINGGAVTATIGVGLAPDGVAVDPTDHSAYVANSGFNSVSVINGGAVTATVGVGAGPDGVAVDPVNHNVYVTNNGANTVSVINAGAVTATLGVGSGPLGVAVDRINHNVYVADNGGTTALVIGVYSVSGRDVAAVQDTPFNYAVTASIIDTAAPGAAAYSATVDWGDSTTSPAVVAGSGPNYVVRASHAYSTAGTFTVTTTATKAGGTLAVTSTATVSAPTPTLTSVTPSQLGQNSVATLTLTGTGFTNNATVTFSNPGITVDRYSHPSSTAMTVKVSVAATATVGPGDVTVTADGNNATCSACLTVDAGPNATKATPALPAGAMTTVMVTGTGFQSGLTATTTIPGATVGTIVNLGATSFQVPITVAPGTAAGTYRIVLTNPDHGTVSDLILHVTA